MSTKSEILLPVDAVEMSEAVTENRDPSPAPDYDEEEEIPEGGKIIKTRQYLCSIPR